MAKKTYFILFILFVIVLVIVFFTGKKNKVEAPAVDDGTLSVGLEEKPLTPSGDVVQNPVTSQEPVIKNGVKEFTISGQNFSFTPNSISVKKDDKVRIIFQNNMGFHDFKIDEYGIATKQAKAPYQEILEFTASKAGSFEFYCSVGTHRAMGMFGTFKVE